jgi:DNA-directed RNA polymerase specialized sigma24 family protein
MARPRRSQGDEGPTENRVISSRSPEKLYRLCKRAAHTVCNQKGYPREAEDTAHNLWIYLHERGHVVRVPEREGAIVIFLKNSVKDELRGRRKRDNSLDSINDTDPEGRAFELSNDNEEAAKILEALAGEELVERILQQAEAMQTRRISKSDRVRIIGSLIKGATQTEIANLLGLEQWEISRWLSALRQRIR